MVIPLCRQACKAMKRTSSWAKARWERNLKGKLSSSQVDPKQWWSLVKQKQGSTSHERIPALKLPAGDLATGGQEKADLLARHFSNKMTTDEPDRLPPVLPQLCETRLDNLVFTEGVVYKHLKNINTKKAPGPDNLSPFLLKHCAEELAGPLTIIFQQCLHSKTHSARRHQSSLYTKRRQK